MNGRDMELFVTCGARALVSVSRRGMPKRREGEHTEHDSAVPAHEDDEGEEGGQVGQNVRHKDAAWVGEGRDWQPGG
jgi:hypothetical protein